MAFPLSPTNGQQAVLNGITYVYNSTYGSWTRLATANAVLVPNTAASTSSVTGALLVSGGVGVVGNINASGNIAAAGNISANYVTVTNTVTANLFAYANGVNILSTIAPSSLYSNSNVAAYLSTSSVTISNITTVNGVFWPNGNAYSSGGGITYTAANSAPASATVGSQWYYSATDTLYEYIYDGTSYYWVDIESPNNFVTNTLSINTNITPSTNNTINIGAPGLYMATTYTANLAGPGSITVTGNLVPSANVAYTLGTPTQRFSSLYLSGNTIDLGGATIKTDATTGAVAIVPTPTTANPNPTGVVVSPSGSISTVSTTGGVITAGAIATSANAAASSGTSTANLTVAGNALIQSSIVSTTSASGALVVQGGVGIGGNLYVGGNLTVLGNTTFVTTTITNESLPGNLQLGSPLNFGAINANLQLGGTQNSYFQFAMQNLSPGSAATTDLVAFADTGTNSYNFVDMGITSSTYLQSGYGLTQANDGYIYMQGNSAGTSGNLVISTYNPRDIIFSTGGGDYGNEIARFSNSSAAFIVKSTTNSSPTANTGALQVWGGASIQGNTYHGGNVNIANDVAIVTTGSGNVTVANTQTVQVSLGGVGVIGDSYFVGNVGVSGKLYENGADVIGTALAFSIALG
jgi:hypothetical protein